MRIQPLALFALPASSVSRPEGETKEPAGPADRVDLRLRTVTLHQPRDTPALKHTHPIEGFCWTPGGKLISTESPSLVGTPSKLRLWDLQGGEPQSFQVAHKNVRIGPVAASGDGELVAVGWEDGKFSVFSSRGVEITHQTHCPTAKPNALGILFDNDDVRSVAFSPDSRTLATGAMDGRLLLWDPEAREQTGCLQHPDWVTDIAFTPDGSKIVTRYRGGVAIWDAREQRLLHKLEDTRKEGGGGMALSADGTKVAAVFEKEIKVFDVETGREVDARAIRGARSLAFTPDGNHLLVGEAIRNAVHDWNLATGEVRRQELPHTPGMASAEGIRQISFSPDGKQLAVSLLDYSLTLWTQSAHNTDLGYLADHLKNGGGGNQVAQLADYVLVGGVRVPRRQ
ncbi:hypothetical protein DYH09_21910 [bacterium CPR1]|nr:hypothetical protein [bacterium CPR1]